MNQNNYNLIKVELEEDQLEFVKKNNIDLDKLTRDLMDELMKKQNSINISVIKKNQCVGNPEKFKK